MMTFSMILMKNQRRNQKRNSTWLLSIDRVESRKVVGLCEETFSIRYVLFDR